MQRNKNDEYYNNLYKKEKEKYIKLFKEMLSFINYQYEYENNDFFYLSNLVVNNYPYYTDTKIHLENLIYNPEESCISLINSMEKIYTKISKDYKDYDENMKKYEEETNQYDFGTVGEKDEF